MSPRRGGHGSRSLPAPPGGTPSCGAAPSKEICALYLRIAGLALRRPWVIPHLLRAAWAFRARGWYRRPPFLPLPPRSYIRWRMETAYGDPNATPTLDELERYLVWTSRMRSQMRGSVDD